MLLEPCTGWREILRAFIHKQFAFCCSSVNHSRHFRYTFATHRPQFCPGSRVGNAIVQTRDGSVCTDGSQKYPGALWTTPSTATQTMGGVCAAERLCAVQQRQTAVNNVGLSSWRSGISVCFLVFITAVSEESSCQSLQAALKPLLSPSLPVFVWLDLS